ncbi:hypothetical protein O9993_10185 [Vibrio lentus]|nr:hypothetical protein [Vibrio lentus]
MPSAGWSLQATCLPPSGNMAVSMLGSQAHYSLSCDPRLPLPNKTGSVLILKPGLIILCLGYPGLECSVNQIIVTMVLGSWCFFSSALTTWRAIHHPAQHLPPSIPSPPLFAWQIPSCHFHPSFFLVKTSVLCTIVTIKNLHVVAKLLLNNTYAANTTLNLAPQLLQKTLGTLYIIMPNLQPRYLIQL